MGTLNSLLMSPLPPQFASAYCLRCHVILYHFPTQTSLNACIIICDRIMNILWYKKVLLRVRKRHTARRIASTRCAGLVGGGVPPGLDLGRRYNPHLDLGRGTPHLDLGREYPPPGPGKGYPPHLDLGRGYPPPGPGKGVPPTWTWEGVTPPQTWDGVPPSSAGRGTPPPRCGLTHRLKILPLPILRMRAVKIGTCINSDIQAEFWCYCLPIRSVQHEDNKILFCCSKFFTTNFREVENLEYVRSGCYRVIFLWYFFFTEMHGYKEGE